MGNDAASGENPHSERAPIVLVPGAFGQDWVYWNVMQYLLERDGFQVYTLSFPRLTLSDLRVSAEMLREKVDEVRESAGAERVNLIAHSMGGLISRYYVKFLGGRASVRHLVALGVPHRGTWAGLTMPLLKGTRQILPGSPFLNALNAVGGDERVPVTNIYSRTDFIVVPPSSARLPSAPNVANHCSTFSGHWGLLVSPKVYGWIRDAIHAPAGGALDRAAEGLEPATVPLRDGPGETMREVPRDAKETTLA